MLYPTTSVLEIPNNCAALLFSVVFLNAQRQMKNIGLKQVIAKIKWSITIKWSVLNIDF